MLSDILNLRLLTISGTEITLATLITAVAIFLLSLLVSHLLQRTIARAMARGGLDQRVRPRVVTRLVHFAVLLIGFAIALDTVGINLSSLFAAGAVFAVGIGFAMQNIAQNFVSGLLLLLERSIKPGDVIAVEGIVVKVVDTRVRTTIARTRDDEELIIPNAMLVQGVVKNYTLQDSVYRLRALVGVTYSSDLRLVRATLERVANSLDWRSARRDPRVQLTGFGDSSVNYDVSVWVDNPWEAPRSLSTMHEEIWWALKDAGIVIAFPQLDIHFDRPVEESIKAFANVA